MVEPRILIDTDTGIDDAMGLLYALRGPSEAVIGMTTLSGNVPRDDCTRNALRIVELVDGDLPVVPGASRTLLGELKPGAPHAHGVTGTGYHTLAAPLVEPDRRTAVDFYASHVAEIGADLAIVATGPLTNVACAYLANVELFQARRPKIFWMGGSFNGIGNITATAEFNAWVDPEAAQVVLASGLDVLILPLDVTELPPREASSICLLPDDLQALESGGKAGSYLAAIVPYYMDFYEQVYAERGCAMHSAVLIAIAQDETLIDSTVWTEVRIETGGGYYRGATTFDRRAMRKGVVAPEDTSTAIVTSVDGASFKRMFMERLTR